MLKNAKKAVKRVNFDLTLKISNYREAVEPIVNERVRLRSLFVPMVIISGKRDKYIYPDNYLELDKKLAKIQEGIYNSYFGLRGQDEIRSY